MDLAPRSEITEISCPIHEGKVIKVPASAAIHCYVWDPKLGLTIEEIRARFPYAIWDANLYRIDESLHATMPRYNLVCERCVASWNEYAVANPPPEEKRFVISISESQKILINDTQFSIEQISAIAEVISNHRPNARVYLRAHKSIPAEFIKAIVNACEDGGLTDVIFGSYTAENERAPTNGEQATN